MYSKVSARLVKRSYRKWGRTSVMLPQTWAQQCSLQHLSWYCSNLFKECEALS